MSEPGEITSLLRRLRSGDRAAGDRLDEKAYPELHRIAEAHFRHERAGHLLQPTALVNEAWQKFWALDAVELDDRVHFLSLCSRLMRQVLVDHARRRATHERAVESMRIEDADLLGPLVIDEILIRLLRTPIGTRVAQIGTPKSGVQQVAEAGGQRRLPARRLPERVAVHQGVRAVLRVSPDQGHRPPARGRFRAELAVVPLIRAVPLTEAQRAELDARLDELEDDLRAGRHLGEPWEEVRKRLK